MLYLSTAVVAFHEEKGCFVKVDISYIGLVNEVSEADLHYSYKQTYIS